MSEDERLSNAFEQRTINELYGHDVDNLGHIYKNCKKYWFRNYNDVAKFMIQVMDNTFEMFGFTKGHVDITWHSDKINKVLKPYGLRYEKRVYQNEDDQWRSGLYLYHKHEIVVWISQPRRVVERRTRDGVIIINDGSKPDLFVLTNARL